MLQSMYGLPFAECILMVAQVGIMPVHHTIGNHCLSVPRAEVTARLRIEGGDYRAVDIAPGWVLIVLDTTEVRTSADCCRAPI